VNILIFLTQEFVCDKNLFKGKINFFENNVSSMVEVMR